MMIHLDGPFASLLGRREHQRRLAELEVGSSALAVSEHGTVEVDWHQLGARALHQARVLLALSAGHTD